METLQISQEPYGRFFESRQDGILILDAESGKIVDVNASFLEIVKYSYDDVIGHSIWDLGVFKDIQAAKDTFKTLQSHANFRHENLQLQTREGHPLCVELVSIASLAGLTKLIQCNIHDVTERMQWINALRESEDRFSKVLQTVPAVAIQGYGIDCIIQYWNEASEKVFGYPVQEAIGRNLLDLMAPPELRENIVNAIRHMFETGQPIPASEFSLMRKNGSRVTVLSSFAIVQIPDHTPELFCFDIDLTDRKQSEDAMKESEARYHRLFSNMSEGFVLCEIIYDDAGSAYDFRPLEVNQAFEDQMGLKADDILGKTARDFFPYIEPSWIEMFGRVVSTGQPARFENFNPMTGRYFEQFAYRVGVNSFAVLTTNITERKRSEQLLRDVQRREAIGVLSGGIAHDFNNLLGVMMGYVSLAKIQFPDQHPAFQQLGKAVTAIDRAAELTQQILAYAGKGKNQIATIDIGEEIRQHVSLFNVSMPKNVALSMHLPSAPVYVSGDPAQIKQVIMNLIANGADAIGNKPGEVSITLAEVTLANEELVHYGMFTNTTLNKGRYALIEIGDTGGGISKDIMDNIFDPFFTTKFTGRGLGLSAVLGIIRGHEGGIAIESTEGKGTLFRIIIPVSAASEPLIEMPPPIDISAPPITATVLVIDDEENIATMAREILESGHYTVLTELNPVLGIQLYKLRQSEIGVVLLDWTMPQMSGKDVIDALQEINPLVKIIISSGYAVEDIAKIIDMKKVAGFIKKPYSLQSLLTFVHSVLL
jgi:two-component system, cell cycle sensor histidine kinase and response regulator CckA